MRILVVDGANMSRLGRREPHLYGSETLAQLHARITALGDTLGVTVECRQSNHEGQLIDWLLAAPDDDTDAVILNAGAYAHTSLAIADAVRSIAPVPVVEVHLTNTAARDAIRHASVVGAACKARIEGFGGDGYLMALTALARGVKSA